MEVKKEPVVAAPAPPPVSDVQCPVKNIYFSIRVLKTSRGTAEVGPISKAQQIM